MTQLDFPEMAINTLLLENADVAAIVGDRIYPVFIPQNITGPFIVYKVITQLPDRHLVSASTLQHVRIQIDCYAQNDDGVQSSYGVVKTLANTVRLALDGFRGNVVLPSSDTVHIDSMSLADGTDIMNGPNSGGDVPLLYVSSDYLIGSQISVPAFACYGVETTVLWTQEPSFVGNNTLNNYAVIDGVPTITLYYNPNTNLYATYTWDGSVWSVAGYPTSCPITIDNIRSNFLLCDGGTPDIEITVYLSGACETGGITDRIIVS